MARERDSVAVHRPGVRSGAHVPLVQLQDPTYEDTPHLVLTDDAERQALAHVVRRETAEEWRQGLLSTQDRRRAALWATVVAVASVGGLGLGVASLVLHYLGH